MENLSLWQFICLCFKTAFKRSLGVFDRVGAILGGVLFLALQLLYPAYWTSQGGQALTTALLLEVPIGAACVFTLARLLIAPYWVYQESQAKHLLTAQDLQKQLSDKDTRLLEYDSPRQKELEIIAFGESFHDIYKEGQQLEIQYRDSNPVIVSTLEKVAEWQQRVRNRLAVEIKSNLFLKYEEISPAGSWVRDKHDSLRQETSKLFQQVTFLRRIIDEPHVFKRSP